MKVMLIVEEKEAPAFKNDGIDPSVAENPLPVGDTRTPSVERLAGRLPVFSTV